jgi:hypothetical protein
MDASEKDAKLFHKLIRANRNSTDVSLVLKSGDDLVHDVDKQLDLWADYFEKLSSKQESPEADEDQSLIEHIRKDAISNPLQCLQVTTSEVERIIGRLNRNKSPDRKGITAEHLIHATTDSIRALTDIINRVLREGNCPTSCKIGFKIPIPKKGKDTQKLTNYRGITITGLIGKIIEHLLQTSTQEALGREASHLQFGFTPGLSPTMASLCLTEAIADAKKEKKELFVAALDAQKAFDVVNHEKLKFKLYCAGVKGTTWRLLDNLYCGISEEVRWCGSFSRSFQVFKGVRQGGVMSTTLYKLFINQVLMQLQSSAICYHLGNIYIGSPTCADDQLLIADNGADMQAMIEMCFNYSKVHQYSLHPEKSTVTTYLSHRKEPDKWQWRLGNELMPTVDSFTHLGLEWTEGNMSPDVNCRISLARKTVYALMGTGLHGVNGLSPVVSLHIIKIYVVPRLLYGLDAAVLARKQREEINNYYRNLLRMIQGLPKSTAR